MFKAGNRNEQVLLGAQHLSKSRKKDDVEIYE